MRKFLVWGCDLIDDIIEADNSEEAASIYFNTEDFESYEKTYYVTLNTREIESTVEEDADFFRDDIPYHFINYLDSFTFSIEPIEPNCSQKIHKWTSPHHILGGLEENPGVWGHGGGVIVQEICEYCNLLKTTDTWAQNPETGEQGLLSIEYKMEGENV